MAQIPKIKISIESSDVKDIIPQREEIIYSSLATVKRENSDSCHKWTTHLLITPNGIAFKESKGMSGELINSYYNWYKIQSIKNFKNPSIIIHKDNASSYSLSLKRNESFETKKDFKERRKEFVAKFNPIFIKRKQQWLQNEKSNLKIKKKIIKEQEKKIKRLIQKERKRCRN